MKTRNALLLAKEEVTPGTAVVPSASTDAVLIEVTGSPFSLNPNTVETDEVTGSLDSAPPLFGGMTIGVNFSVLMKGSGVAGVAPEYGDLMRAAAFVETLSAATVPAGGAEALAAGGSAVMAVLGATASSTAQIYRGMPITFTGTVPGSSFIYDYSASKNALLTDTLGGNLVATTNYLIEKNVRYQPGSTSIPALTFYIYMDGLRYIFAGCRGTAGFDFSVNQPGRIRFAFQGMFISKADASLPAAVFDAAKPPVWINGRLKYNRIRAAGNSLTLDTGADTVYAPDPNEPEGVSPPEHIRRRMRGSLGLMQTLVSTRDVLAHVRAQTEVPLIASMGSVEGNRVALVIPKAQPLNEDPTDQGGLLGATVPYAANGYESGASLVLW